MAEITSNITTAAHDMPKPAYSWRAVSILRLSLGLVVLLGSVTFFLGTSWDIQWHIFLGRDRTLIPPHIVMLSGVTVSGLAALAAVLIETLWQRRGRIQAEQRTEFADSFYGSLGAFLGGFGALNTAVAFPLDSYWHSLYGVDVSIWAPFHVMLIIGMALVALGATYMLLSAAHLAPTARISRMARIGAAIALAALLSILTFLIFNSMGDQGTLDLGIVVINVFPLLEGALLAWVFVTAARVLPWRWSATTICAISFFLVIIVALFVPPAIDYLMKLENLNFRATHSVVGPHLAIVALEWPLASIACAFVIDLFWQRAQRKAWTPKRFIISTALVALVGCVPVMPLIFLTFNYFSNQGFYYAFDLLLGLGGTLLGVWLGNSMSNVLSGLER